MGKKKLLFLSVSEQYTTLPIPICWCTWFQIFNLFDSPPTFQKCLVKNWTLWFIFVVL